MEIRQTRVGVATWVFQDGKTLLGKRKNAHGEETWACPGGHLEFGESPQDTARRELKEETHLDAQRILEGPWTHDFFPELSKHYVTLHLFVTEFSGDLRLMEPDKCEKWQWFDLQDLPKNLFLPIQNLFKLNTLSQHLERAFASDPTQLC